MNFTELNKQLESILKKYQDGKGEDAIKELMDLADSNKISPENIDEYKDDFRMYQAAEKIGKPAMDKALASGNIHDIYESMYVFNMAKSNLNQLNQAVVSIKQELVKKAQYIRTELEKAKKLKEMEEREKIAQAKKQ